MTACRLSGNELPMKKDTSFRNLLMLQMIPREPQTITVDILKERLADQGYEVHMRTIQRDLNKYSLKFGITSRKAEDNSTNCWCWSRDAALLDIPEMNSMTALTFNLVETFLSRLIPNSVLNFMEPHFKRARFRLEKLHRSTWSGWTDKIKLVPRGLSLLPSPIDSVVYETIFEAVLKEQQIALDYRKRNAQESTRYLLNPLGMVFNQEVVYLLATKKGQGNIQQFALHRVESANIESMAAEIPKGFSVQDYIDQGAFQYNIQGKPVLLKVQFEKEIAAHLYESKLSPEQTMTEQDNGKVQLEAEMHCSSALKWWLLGFGDGVEVIEPKELREEFRQIFNKLANKYKD